MGKGSALMRPPKASIMPPTSAARHVGGGPVDFGGTILDVALGAPEYGLRSIKPTERMRAAQANSHRHHRRNDNRGRGQCCGR